MIISNGGVLTKQSERRRRKMSESETVWFYDVWLAIQVCSRLKHVFNIRGSSFNSFLINSLFTACRRSEVIIMRRVVRERSRIVHCTRFDGFRFFCDGLHDETRSQTGISINSTYRLFLHVFFFLRWRNTRNSNFGWNSVMQCVIKQSVKVLLFEFERKKKNFQVWSKQTRALSLHQRVVDFQKFVLMHEKRPWGERCLPIVFVSFLP